MRNIMAIILISSTAISFMCAKTIKNNVPSSMGNFFYQKGYKEGYENGYQRGYQQAINDVLKRLSKYKAKMEAIEAGKYLLATGQITYPQVYKVSLPDGGYKIVIIPPKVEDKLSLDSLIEIPNANNICNNIYNNNNNNDESYNGAFSLNNQDNLVQNGIKSVKSINNQTTLHFPKTQKVFDILLKSGIPFVENADSYTVYFQNAKQKDYFCKNIGGRICESAY